MRLSETYLTGFGIDPKKVRPIAILDVIDGMLSATNISKAAINTEKISGLHYNNIDELSSISYLADNLTFIKLVGNQKAVGLYLKIFPYIEENLTTIEVNKDELVPVLGEFKNDSSFYRALSSTMLVINKALEDCVVLYNQYDKVAEFTIVYGSTKDELLRDLAKSGKQSPSTIDKINEILFIRGGSES